MLHFPTLLKYSDKSLFSDDNKFINMATSCLTSKILRLLNAGVLPIISAYELPKWLQKLTIIISIPEVDHRVLLSLNMH